MAKKKNEFPNVLMVTMETENNGDQFLITHDSPQDIGRGMDNNMEQVTVAKYKLIGVDKLHFLPQWKTVKKIKY